MRNNKRKRATTLTENDGDTNLKEVNSTIPDKKRLIVDTNDKLTKSTIGPITSATTASSVLNTSTSSLLSLKENLGEKRLGNDNKIKSSFNVNDRNNEILMNNKALNRVTETRASTKLEEFSVTSTSTTNAVVNQEQEITAISRRFKSKKTNLKNLQNKKISASTSSKTAAFNNTVNSLIRDNDFNLKNDSCKNNVESENAKVIIETNNNIYNKLVVNNKVTVNNNTILSSIQIQKTKPANVINNTHNTTFSNSTTIASTTTTTAILTINKKDEATVPLPKLNWASNKDLWEIMIKKCEVYKYDYLYLRKHPGIEAQMRAILFDWIMEISHAYRLHRETFHLAIEYIDRFLSSTEKLSVDRLQLIGITALFIASKVEEIYPPKLKDFAYHMEDYSNDNETEIAKFELYMLKTLNWRISPLTAHSWLNIFLQIKKYNNSNHVVHNTSILLPKDISNDYIKAITLIDLCMFDIECLKYKYSEIAACAMYYTIKPSELAFNSSGYKFNELQQCLNWMYPFAEIINEHQEKMKIMKFSDIDQHDFHNIQLYFSHLDYIKEARLRRTPAKTNNFDDNPFILTPPDSNKKKL